MTTSTTSTGLSDTQLETFHKDGCLIIPNFLSPETVTSLLSETHKLLQDFPLETHPMTRFTTGDSSTEAHVGDTYFLSSGDKIHFFFEPAAFSSSGTLTKPKEKAINKIGHYLHALSPPFQQSTITSTNAAIAKDLDFEDPRVLQSMIICKQPEIGGAVPSHQDSTFLYTNPPSAIGFWIALEDATKENGCLSFAKGSHRRESVRNRFVRVGEGTGFVETEGSKWPKEFRTEEPLKDGKEEVFEMGEVKAGSLVLIHGNLLHKSERNTSDKGRIIYTFHVIEGNLDYDERNWLQPPEEGFTRLLGS